jgi:hypothetical protein
MWASVYFGLKTGKRLKKKPLQFLSPTTPQVPGGAPGVAMAEETQEKT